jgi:hypothetical protein
MTGPDPAPRLCELQVPGLDVPRASAHARARLLARYAQITDVLATTRPATLLIIYRGEEQVEAWAAALEPVVCLAARGRTSKLGDLSARLTGVSLRIPAAR